MGRSSCDLIDYVRGAPDGVYGARDGTGGGEGLGVRSVTFSVPTAEIRSTITVR